MRSTRVGVPNGENRIDEARALRLRGDALATKGLLPADYFLQCKTLADVRKAVEGAERATQPTPPICDAHGRVKGAWHETAHDTRPEGEHLARYGH